MSSHNIVHCLRSESGLCLYAEVWVGSVASAVAPASKAVDSRAAASATRGDARFTGRGVARRKSRPWCARVGWPMAPRRGGVVTSLPLNQQPPEHHQRLLHHSRKSLLLWDEQQMSCMIATMYDVMKPTCRHIVAA